MIGMSLSITGRRAPAAPTFNVASIAGYALDYDLTDSQYAVDASGVPCVDGGQIAQILDRSGNARHTTVQATAAKRAIYKTGIIGGKNVARLDPVDDGYTTPLVLTAPFTVVAVYAMRQGGGTTRVINGGSSNWLMGGYINEHRVYAGAFVTGPAITIGAAVVTRAVQSGGAVSLTVNGTGAGSVAASTAPNPMTIGAVGVFAEPSAADLARLIVYTTALSAPDSAALDAYLKSLYGIT